MKKVKYVLSALVFTFLSVKQLSAQTYGNVNYNQYDNKAQHQLNQHQRSAQFSGNDNILYFEVNALMNKEADSYLAVFNVVQVGPTAAAADSLFNIKYKKLLTELHRMGVDTNEVMLDIISLIPTFEVQVEKKLFSKTYTEIPLGFELQKNIHIRYKDAQKLDRILTAAAKNEIYDLIKVDYFVEDVSKIYTELRRKAIAYLNTKVKDYEALGVELDTAIRVIAETDNVVYPKNRYFDYQAFCSSTIEAIGKNSGITQAHKPKSKYYEKLPYDQYDVIINPSILEPPVQYTYNLKVKFVKKEPVRPAVRTEIKHQYHYKVITPDGKIQNLNVP